MSADADAPPNPGLHARMQVAELVKLFEEIDWSRVDGMSVAEAAALAERLREVAEE